MECQICGKRATDKHHMIHGRGRRAKADKYGLIISVCRQCHRRIHEDRALDLEIIKSAQEEWEAKFGDREQFIREFGKSWL